MLKVHGVVKVVKASAPKSLGERRWAINLAIQSRNVDWKTSEFIWEELPAVMYIYDPLILDKWVAALEPGTNLVLVDSEIGGADPADVTNGKYNWWDFQVKLFADEKRTIVMS
jgi:hypothetical protein